MNEKKLSVRDKETPMGKAIDAFLNDKPVDLLLAALSHIHPSSTVATDQLKKVNSAFSTHIHYRTDRQQTRADPKDYEEASGMAWSVLLYGKLRGKEREKGVKFEEALLVHMLSCEGKWSLVLGYLRESDIPLRALLEKWETARDEALSKVLEEYDRIVNAELIAKLPEQWHPRFYLEADPKNQITHAKDLFFAAGGNFKDIEPLRAEFQKWTKPTTKHVLQVLFNGERSESTFRGHQKVALARLESELKARRYTTLVHGVEEE